MYIAFMCQLHLSEAEKKKEIITVHLHYSYTNRSPSSRSVTSDGNQDLHKGEMSTRHGNYLGNYHTCILNT